MARYRFSFPRWLSIPTGFRQWRTRRLLWPGIEWRLDDEGACVSDVSDISPHPEPVYEAFGRHKDDGFAEGSNYHFPVNDQYTPTASQAPPLHENIANPKVWGYTPYDYVRWFDTLWHTGDPSGWGPEVFTRDAVMIDSTGTSYGGDRAAADFLLLFDYFPELRGEVVSWAHNNTEIMINWRFVVRANLTVPVIDKFSFNQGLVSFRQAYFDVTMLLSYLTEIFGSAAMADFFVDRFWRSQTTGGVMFFPSLIWALIKGLFLWSPVPLEAPAGLTATSGDGKVVLRWNAVEGAISYKVMRATEIGGPYKWIKAGVPGTSYTDTTVTNGTKYFYKVCANLSRPPLPEPE